MPSEFLNHSLQIIKWKSQFKTANHSSNIWYTSPERVRRPRSAGRAAPTVWMVFDVHTFFLPVLADIRHCMKGGRNDHVPRRVS